MRNFIDFTIILYEPLGLYIAKNVQRGLLFGLCLIQSYKCQPIDQIEDGISMAKNQYD